MSQGRSGVSVPLKVLRSGVLAVVLAAAIWHLLPLVVWEAIVEPELETGLHPRTLDVPTLEVPSAAPQGWSRLSYEGVSIRVPLADASHVDCERQPGVCRRKLVGGSMGIHAHGPQETFEQMIDFRAPDQDDLSLFRSATSNWRTIRALRTRVTTSRGKIDAWRYIGAHSKGVVAQTQADGYPRYVVSAYSPDGRRAAVVGVQGLHREAVVQMFGSLRFVD